MALGKIKADTLEHSTAGSLDTSYVVNGSAKAWANFNGSGTLAVRDSFNVTSISDDGTGLYSVDFGNAMSDGNYAALGCATYFGNDSATGLVYAMRTSSNVYTEHGTAGFALRISDNNADSALDSGSVELTVMGDLALMTQTPQFQGTHLFDRLCWAKENLDGVQSDYRVVYEDSIDECAKILVPDPNWMACALQGGILPPVQVYWELAKDEAKPDFVKHTRGHLLHNTEPVEAMTEEQAIEYLIMKDCPQHVWRDYDSGNKPKMVICRKEQLPSTREWRNAWKITDELATDETVAA